MLQDLLAQIPDPLMVEHVEKQPEEVAERSNEDYRELEVRSEIILIMNSSLLVIHHKLLPKLNGCLCLECVVYSKESYNTGRRHAAVSRDGRRLTQSHSALFPVQECSREKSLFSLIL